MTGWLSFDLSIPAGGWVCLIGRTEGVWIGLDWMVGTVDDEGKDLRGKVNGRREASMESVVAETQSMSSWVANHTVAPSMILSSFQAMRLQMFY